MLSQHGVLFEAYNVEKTPEAWRDLQRHHIPMVPAVIVGDRSMHGWNPRALAELFGWPYEQGTRLAHDDLLARLEVVLDIAHRALGQIPDKHLDIKTPDRDRPLRRLAPHIFRIAQSFLEAAAGGSLLYESLTGDDAPPFRSMAEILVFGEEVRGHVRAWIAGPGGVAWDSTVETYYGPSRLDDLLERTVWHCAQHVRHLHWLMAQLGIVPERPLRPEDVRGLPLPEALW